MPKFPSVIDLSHLGGLGFRLDGEAAFDFSGYSVSSAGDVNGDGFDDFVIGALTQGPIGAGAAYVVFGGSSGFPAVTNLASLNGTNGFKLSGHSSNEFAGGSVAGGDVNGDGFSDIIVGAYRADPNGKVNAGTAYVVYGHAGGFPANTD